MKNRVLIVATNEDFRRVLREYLQDRQLCSEIFEADSAHSGLNRLLEIGDDPTVLIDLDLPDMNGIEMTRLVNIKNPSSSIIILSFVPADLLRRVTKHLKIEAFVYKDEIFESLENVFKSI